MPVDIVSDERAALRAAITKAADAVREADKARAAAERARGISIAARGRLSLAESMLVEAREKAIDGLIDGEQPQELRDLRRALADATDDVALAGEAVSRAEAALAEPEYAERKAAESVNDAADAIVGSEAEDALRAYEKSFAEAERRKAVFVHIAGRMKWSDDERYRRLNAYRNNFTFRMDAESGKARAAAVAPWEIARAALTTDPDAPLPTIG